MQNEFTLVETFAAKPADIYQAWLSSDGHSSMTGSPANVDGRVDGDFTAWDGYIWGTFLELEEDRWIRQAWRTTEFPEDAEDSEVEILLEDMEDGTRLTLIHTKIPEGQAESYKQGWEDFYFKPMKIYFSS